MYRQTCYHRFITCRTDLRTAGNYQMIFQSSTVDTAVGFNAEYSV